MVLPRPLGDIAAACMLLTRVPVPFDAGPPRPEAAWAWPLAGLLVGVIGGAVGIISLSVGLAPGVAGLLALGAMMLATGGLHEDGLADTADGMWGARTPQRRLEIMRDSRVGTYGILALIVVTGLRWQALAILADAGNLALFGGVVAAAMVSRAPMALIMTAIPPARSDGLSKLVGRPPAWAGWSGVALAALCAALVCVTALPVLVVLAPIPGLVLGLLAKRRLGGQTGDILGATQQVTEAVVLCVLVVHLG